MSALGREPPVVTVRDFFALATCYAGSTGRNRPEADCRLRPVLMGTNLLEKFMRFGTAAFALLLTHGLAAAGGYHGWEFGMTQAQIRAVGDPARYYTFKNGDIGAGHVPFENGEALISFYFTDGYLERTMLIAYRGEDASSARQAWTDVYAHLARVCGDVESLSAGVGASTREAALTAYDKDLPSLAPGKRHQMGCLRMPAGERVWATATRGEGKLVMVAVNYGKP